jgi:2-dehydropantoate 2-reductase
MKGRETHTSDQILGHSLSNSSSPIHVLGIGNIGKLFSHALATKPGPPTIVLLLHRASLLDDWDKSGRSIEIISDGVSNKDGIFQVEEIRAGSEETNENLADGFIQHLIVATKTIHTVAALSSIKHRLGASSNILFAQNGMGTIEDVSQTVFPQEASRPQYFTCVTSHGIYSKGPFSSVHAGKGNISIGSVHARKDQPAYIVQQILQASILTAKEVSPFELKLLQLEKLAINSMINPLTAIFNRKNGELFSSPAILQLMRLLLMEVSHVIRAFPELQHDPAMQERFSLERLHAIVLDVARITAKNTSSMLQDVKAGRRTEIDYINGYIVRRGNQLDIHCKNNQILSDLVRRGQTIMETEIKKHFPEST